MATRVMNTKSKSKPINLWIEPFSGLPMSLIQVNPQFGFKKFTILPKLPAPAISPKMLCFRNLKAQWHTHCMEQGSRGPNF